jgi:hypothetical protein
MDWVWSQNAVPARDQHTDKQDRHQQVLQEGGIGAAYQDPELGDEGVLDDRGTDEAEMAPKEEPAENSRGNGYAFLVRLGI